MCIKKCELSLEGRGLRGNALHWPLPKGNTVLRRLRLGRSMSEPGLSRPACFKAWSYHTVILKRRPAIVDAAAKGTSVKGLGPGLEQ